MWARATSSRDNWERLVAAVIKKDQIWQLCHQDSITTVDSDFSNRSLSRRSLSPASSAQLPLTRNLPVEVPKYGYGTISLKLFSALLWRKKSKGLAEIPEDHFGLEMFSLGQLLVATDHFSVRNIIGRGGLGDMYRGQFADGSLVAVKRFNDRVSLVMAKQELEITSNIVTHCNVIVPIGFCITKKERLLVYPYIPNGNVAQCLRESHAPLEWAIRLRVALGVARGVAHLHHGCIRGIIHRNVKAANILLDEHFEAAVSYFTLARFVDCKDDDEVKGTLGHIAPEYISTKTCSLKTDVYGYGVLLLELISGQPASELISFAYDDDCMVLIDWVMKLWEERKFEALIDQYLRGNFMEEEVEMLLQIALICTQTDPERRPAMSEVVMMVAYGDGLTEAWEEFLQIFSKTTSGAE